MLRRALVPCSLRKKEEKKNDSATDDPLHECYYVLKFFPSMPTGDILLCVISGCWGGSLPLAFTVVADNLKTNERLYTRGNFLPSFYSYDHLPSGIFFHFSPMLFFVFFRFFNGQSFMSHKNSWNFFFSSNKSVFASCVIVIYVRQTQNVDVLGDVAQDNDAPLKYKLILFVF